MSTTDKIKNAAQDASGKVAEKIGEWTGDDDLRDEGRSDQAESKAKQAGEKLKDAADDVKEAASNAVDAIRT